MINIPLPNHIVAYVTLLFILIDILSNTEKKATKKVVSIGAFIANSTVKMHRSILIRLQ